MRSARYATGSGAGQPVDRDLTSDRNRGRHAVPSFPTVSEVWLRLLEAIGT